MEPQMTSAERTDEVGLRIRAIRDEIERILASQHEYDDAERRKQAIKARIRQMDAERRARYASFW